MPPQQHLRFEFDPRKAAFNLRKHGVSFDEAIASFYDTHSKTGQIRTIQNPVMNDSSTSEERPRFASSLWFIMRRTV